MAPTTSSPILMTMPPPNSIRCGNCVNRLEKPATVFERSTKAFVSILNEAAV
jgi:hypothetical protein